MDSQQPKPDEAACQYGGSGCEEEFDDLFLALSQQQDASSTPPSPTSLLLAPSSSHPPPATSSSYLQPPPASPTFLLPAPTTVSPFCQPLASVPLPASSNPVQFSGNSVPKPSKRPFSTIKTDREIELARSAAIPKTTQNDTKYCVNLWDAWVRYRLEENGDSIMPLIELTKDELNYWLTRFILEVSNHQQLCTFLLL